MLCWQNWNPYFFQTNNHKIILKTWSWNYVTSLKWKKTSTQHVIRRLTKLNMRKIKRDPNTNDSTNIKYQTKTNFKEN